MLICGLGENAADSWKIWRNLDLGVGRPRIGCSWPVGLRGHFGDVAQLVERLHGMQEVVSSILIVSTCRERLWHDVKGVF